MGVGRTQAAGHHEREKDAKTHNFKAGPFCSYILWNKQGYDIIEPTKPC